LRHTGGLKITCSGTTYGGLILFYKEKLRLTMYTNPVFVKFLSMKVGFMVFFSGLFQSVLGQQALLPVWIISKEFLKQLQALFAED